MSEDEQREDERAQRVAEALFARETIAQAWDMRLESVRAGYARVSMILRQDMLNGHGTAHGGVIFTLADSAFAYACNSRNVETVAQQASISFLVPARLGDRLVAEASENGVVGRSGVYIVRVTRDDGALIALFNGLSRALGGAILPMED
jgi:acyl-CoA thioesterase